jgi:hypothetical protein
MLQLEGLLKGSLKNICIISICFNKVMSLLHLMFSLTRHWKKKNSENYLPITLFNHGGQKWRRPDAKISREVTNQTLSGRE